MDTLENIKKYAEEVQASWNGDEAGIQEDRYNIASDVLEAVKNLEELLAELN